MISIRQPRATLIQFFVATLGFCGIPASTLLPKIEYKFIAAILFFIGFAVAILKGNKQIIHLETKSHEFDKFFQDWYAKEGVLHVYCTELDWLPHGAITSLERKASDRQLCLYLKSVTSVADRLKGKGARLFHIPELKSGHPKHKFSLLENDGLSQIICRSKTLDQENGKTGNIIQFVATNNSIDPHLLALANEALENCSEIL